MERLTKRGKEGVAYWNGANGVHYSDNQGNIYGNAITKLAEYEDTEEQGLLIRLPCKVGDDVWTIMCGMTGKHPALFRQEFTLSMFSHFGTAVFLTKEEAEAALAEMEG